MPYTEGFETGLHTKYWTIVNSDSDKTWDTITLASSGGGTVAWMNFYDYLRINKRDQLISAPMNFSDYSALHLNFDHAYAQRASLKDSLIVSISSDCGETWTRILAAGPDNNNPNVFATHANTLEPFYPTSAYHWCGSSYGTECYSLDISQWAGQSSVKIMFESFNRHGNNLFIDNIEIDGPVGIPGHGKGDPGIRIYPNPSNGVFNLTIEKVNSDLDLIVYDLQGQKVYTDRILSGTGIITKEINLGSLSKGIYYLRLTSENVTRVEKIVIN